MYSNPADAQAMTKEQFREVMEKHEKLGQALEQSNELLNGAGLAYLKDSMSVQLEGEKPLVTNAKSPESGEEMTAYYVVECTDQERAIAIAKQILDFHVTRVEVRFIHDAFGMSTESPSTS